jgi:two-component system OmpR family response regulator
MPELAARVRAMLRRQSGHANPVFEKGSVAFVIRNGCVSVDGIPIDLTA